MDPVQVVTSVSTALGESDDAVRTALRTLFRTCRDAGCTDRPGVEQVLSAQPPVEYGKLAALLDALRALAAEAGSAEDPRVVLEDYESRWPSAARSARCSPTTASRSPRYADTRDVPGAVVHRIWIRAKTGALRLAQTLTVDPHNLLTGSGELGPALH